VLCSELNATLVLLCFNTNKEDSKEHYTCAIKRTIQFSIESC